MKHIILYNTDTELNTAKGNLDTPYIIASEESPLVFEYHRYEHKLTVDELDGKGYILENYLHKGYYLKRGQVNSNYVATTQNIAEADTVYFEKISGNEYLLFVIDSNTRYYLSYFNGWDMAFNKTNKTEAQHLFIVINNNLVQIRKTNDYGLGMEENISQNIGIWGNKWTESDQGKWIFIYQGEAPEEQQGGGESSGDGEWTLLSDLDTPGNYKINNLMIYDNAITQDSYMNCEITFLVYDSSDNTLDSNHNTMISIKYENGGATKLYMEDRYNYEYLIGDDNYSDLVADGLITWDNSTHWGVVDFSKLMGLIETNREYNKGDIDYIKIVEIQSGVVKSHYKVKYKTS